MSEAAGDAACLAKDLQLKLLLSKKIFYNHCKLFLCRTFHVHFIAYIQIINFIQRMIAVFSKVNPHF